MKFISILNPTKDVGLAIVRRDLSSFTETRVRFAPSPTGSIHLGGLRSAFYNYIFAKQNNGSFILRIEDTDRSRTVPGSADEIEKVLNWAGLSPDESPSIGGKYGPYTQSARLDLYKDRVHELLESEKAYRCFCSLERLELLRKYQSRNREKPGYDGKCRHLSPGEIKEKLIENHGQFAVRFALQPNSIEFDDLIFGKINTDLLATKETDPVIMKRDSYPTYHFANVVDDNAMRISHVLRGSEWISSTAKHIQIYQAFGWPLPNFAHFPLITMSDGTKMSKRNNQSHVKSWIDAGYAALPVLNFLTNMGGGVPKEKQDSNELWELNRLVKEFKFGEVVCHPGSVNVDRLNIYNSKYIRKCWSQNPQDVLEQFKSILEKHDIATDLDDEHLSQIIGQSIGRIILLGDLITGDTRYIWKCPELTWSREEYIQIGWNLKEVVKNIISIIEESDIEDKTSLDSKLRMAASDLNLGLPMLMQFIRKLLTNCGKGLPVHDIFKSLGKQRLLVYLENGLKYVDQ